MPEDNGEVNATTARVYEVLRRKILEESYSHDTKFNQNEIAKQLGVSRTPVVKALHMLESEGFVDNIPQRGFFIHRVTLREMLDLFVLRQALEMVAAYHAAETATQEDISRLSSFFKPFIGGEDWDADRYFVADRGFHDVLFSLCKNSLAVKVNQSLQIMNKTYVGGLLREPHDTLPEHLAIIDAIRDRDPEKAQIAVMRHLEKTRKRVQTSAEQLSLLGVDVDRLAIHELPMNIRRS